MKLEFKETLDSITDGIKETADTVQKGTSDFHEKYVSKVLPDCGKYGDVAKFAAEMIPGVSEYNALVDGDWTGFAISAGIDIATLGIGSAVIKAGTAGVKASGEVIEAGAKKVVSVVSEKVAKETTEEVVKDIAKEGAEKLAKETLENTAEKAMKEVAEEGVEKAAKEVVEEGAEKTSLKVGESIDKAKLPESFKEVEKITGTEIHLNQKELLEKAIKETDYKKLESSELKEARNYFNNHKPNLIKQWEQNTGKEWPRYTNDILDSNGEVFRKAGRYKDGHHFIELSTGGQNEWWNLYPVSVDEHNAIHAAGSITSEIFR